jgi:hypothetical protein
VKGPYRRCAKHPPADQARQVSSVCLPLRTSNAFRIHGEAQAGDRIALFVGDSAETSGFSGKHPQRAGADGRFRLQVQHSSTKSWSLGRCRFPDYGELLIVSDERPWRRVRIELPRAVLLSKNPVIVLPADVRACPQPETKRLRIALVFCVGMTR